MQFEQDPLCDLGESCPELIALLLHKVAGIENFELIKYFLRLQSIFLSDVAVPRGRELVRELHNRNVLACYYPPVKTIIQSVEVSRYPNDVLERMRL